MMFLVHKILMLLIVLSLAVAQLPVNACATCGCSEMCPIAMMQASSSDAQSTDSLTDSIWGNTILKMAYHRDEELQRLARRIGLTTAGTYMAFSGMAAGTLAQGVVSMATLNPPDGVLDSYTPGTIGLGLSGAAGLLIGGRTILNYRCNKKIKARKIIIKQQVEAILEHLEFSKSACPKAQKELAGLIGERAAQECIQLWQSSHNEAIAAAVHLNRSL